MIRLFELEFAGVLESFDEGVFELELADEAQPRREAVVEQQHETMEVEDAGPCLARR